jgi:uncharacterized protein
MRTNLIAVFAAGLLAFTMPVNAETISFGSSQAGGPNYSIALAIAKELNEATSLDVRLVPRRSPSQVLPLVNSNEQQLGATSGVELTAARNGEGSFSGNELTQLRAIGTLFPFRLTYSVRKDSGIETVADLKGTRMASGYRASTTGHILSSAILAAAGISFDDVTPVEVSDFMEAREFFIEGRTDAVHYIVGSGVNARLDSQAGGIRAIGIPPSEDVDKILHKIHPTLRSMKVAADAEAIGLENDILVMAYDYLLYTNASMPDETVASIAEILLENAAAMAQSFAAFRAFDPTRIASDAGIPYHPAALALYRAKGLAPE